MQGLECCCCLTAHFCGTLAFWATPHIATVLCMQHVSRTAITDACKAIQQQRIHAKCTAMKNGWSSPDAPPQQSPYRCPLQMQMRQLRLQPALCMPDLHGSYGCASHAQGMFLRLLHQGTLAHCNGHCRRLRHHILILGNVCQSLQMYTCLLCSHEYASHSASPGSVL